MLDEQVQRRAGETFAPPAAAELDATGLICPMPVLKARKRLRELPQGAVLLMRADDPAAREDMVSFCQESGHRLTAVADLGCGVVEFRVVAWDDRQTSPEA